MCKSLVKDLEFFCINQNCKPFLLPHDLGKAVPSSLYIPDFLHSSI